LISCPKIPRTKPREIITGIINHQISDTTPPMKKGIARSCEDIKTIRK
jgi:hypothetical protein